MGGVDEIESRRDTTLFEPKLYSLSTLVNYCTPDEARCKR